VQSFRYKAFISYSHTDDEWAEWLLRKLEAYCVPKHLVGSETQRGQIPARLAPIFRDRDELPAADSLTNRLNEAIVSSEYMIVICSPRAAQSRLVNKEIVEFKRVHGEKNILAMVVSGQPFANDSSEECFPPALMQKYSEYAGSVNFAAEGIAADVRTEGDGKRRSLLKIVAGMIGVGLDALVRREERRRQKRMAAVLTASIAATFITGGLAYEARTARIAADLSAQEAKKKARQSLLLTSTVMSTLYEELLGVGNLKALEAIVEKILGPYYLQTIETANSAEFYQYGGTVMRLGQMLDRKGESTRARKIFDNMLVLSRAFHAKNPKDKYAIFRLQNNLFFVGYLALRQGRFEEATAAYRERLQLAHFANDLFSEGSYLRLSDKMRHSWESTIADAENNLAPLLSVPLGEPAQAIRHAQLSLKRRLAFDDKEFDKNVFLYSLGSSHQNLGDAQRAAGNLVEAFQSYQDRLSLFEAAQTEIDGKNYRLLRRRYTSLQNIGHILMDRGDYGEAVATYKEAAAGFDILTDKDPANTLWLAGSAELYNNLANAYFSNGNVADATEALATARLQSDETMRRDNTRVRRQVTAYEISLLEASILLKQGEKNGALNKLEQLLSAIDVKGENFLRTNHALALYAKAHVMAGQLLLLQNKNVKAQAHWRQVVDTLEKTAATVTPQAKISLASAYRLLNMQDKATKVKAELQQFGFASANIKAL